MRLIDLPMLFGLTGTAALNLTLIPMITQGCLADELLVQPQTQSFKMATVTAQQNPATDITRLELEGMDRELAWLLESTVPTLVSELTNLLKVRIESRLGIETR